MLIRLTRHCDMGCSHCMLDAQPDGRHMKIETLTQVIDFLLGIRPLPLNISGGEPFAHPQLLPFLAAMLRCGLDPAVICLISNGEALQDPANLAMIEHLNIRVSVTNDRRYYPRAVVLPPHPLIHFYDQIPTEVQPLGRGRNLASRSWRKGPDCFNLRSFARNGESFQRAVVLNHLRGRTCTPCIDYDGSIYLGEHTLCQRIGHVTDTFVQLTGAVRSLSCNNCGLCSGLPAEYRQAIGM